LLVVENDSLTTPLFINPLQDTVSCAVKWNGYTQPSYTQLTYGYPSSNIRAPKTGQSIASYFPDGFWYSITKFPSIGFANDSTGMMGTVKGMIYDKNGLPLVNMSNKGLAFDYSSLYIGFTFFPQPVKQQLLNYEISIPVKSAETYLIFRNMNGQEIYRFLVTENKGVITLPENIKNGAYIVQLIANKKNYATNKLIVQ